MLFSQESELVPFERASLPPGAWLVLAPHPDDEVLGMGGTLALAIQQEIPITVVFVSSGEKAGAAQKREKEALLSLKEIGLKEALFWRLPDREIANHFDFFAQKFLKILNRKYKSVFVPSFLEFHPDHRAVTWFTLTILEMTGWQGELWLYEISRQGEINRLIDISNVIDRKIAAIKAYKSQLIQNAYLEISLALNRARAYTLATPKITYAEGFWAGTPAQIANHWFEHLKKYLPFPLN